MKNYLDNYLTQYHFDHVYNPILKLADFYLYQVGEKVIGNGYVYPEHKQWCHEISYVVSGNCDFYTDGKVFHAKQGDIHVISKDMRHRIVVGEDDKLRMAYIGFAFREDCTELNEMKDFYENAPMLLQNDKYFLRTLFEQILNEAYISQPFFSQITNALLMQILIHVYRIFQYGGVEEEHRIVEESRIERIIGHTVLKVLRYIDNNLDTLKGVSQIADELKYSSAYLSRVFHEKMGITLRQYIDVRKVEKGKQLLKEGMTVSETATRLGYASCQSFDKLFARYEGCSPTIFLRRERNK